MTAIAAVLGHPTGDRATPDRMLAAMARRGADRSDVWSGSEAQIAVSRAGWECAPEFAGPVLVARDECCVVAADASLYYHEDLRRRLTGAGVGAAGQTASDLILAAYRAWGPRCAEHLEGDFAFILWDWTERRLVCARDFAGKRPLFYARNASTLVVASTIRGVLAGPGAPRELNLAADAADAAGLFAADADTCYEGVTRLAAGSTLVVEGGLIRVGSHWAPAPVRGGVGSSFDEAAEQLATLLERAAAERLSAGGTSVWLSGGWDSTAVFASGERSLAARGGRAHLRAVSVSYPAGDPGREDELIEAVVGWWGSPVHWIDVDTIPLLDAPEATAARRDEPFAHGFETTSRALARASGVVGTRVALDGTGGDQLFQLSPVYLADLLRAGRWTTLAREWRARGFTGGRTFFRYAVQPLLPRPALQAAAWMRGGRALRGQFEPVLAPWIRADFARRHGLIERDRAARPARRGRSAAELETHWQLTDPFFPRVLAAVSTFALEEGIELRSPLFDRRVVEFALTRPREERVQGAETKRLLRRAMRGALPDAVLAPRARRTGVPGAYLVRSLRRRHAAQVEWLLAAPLALEALGVVDGGVLRDAWQRFRRGDNSVPALHLLLTLHADLWLRARLVSRADPPPAPPLTRSPLDQP